MLTRQNIVIILAVMALIYGLYNVPLMPTPRLNIKNIDRQTNLTAEFTADLRKKMSKGGFSKTGVYILSKASSEWGDDVFLTSRLPTQHKAESDTSNATATHDDLSYSGFLETQNMRLAIINGREYEEGEELEENGYVVLRILPTQIMVGEKGKVNKFSVELKETK